MNNKTPKKFLNGAVFLETSLGLPIFLLSIFVFIDICYFFVCRFYTQWIAQSFLIEASKIAVIDTDLRSSNLISENALNKCRGYNYELRRLVDKYKRKLEVILRPPTYDSGGSFISTPSLSYYKEFELYSNTVYKEYGGGINQSVGAIGCELEQRAPFDFLRPGERNKRVGIDGSMGFTDHPTMRFVVEASEITSDYFDPISRRMSKHPMSIRLEFVFKPLLGLGIVRLPIKVEHFWYEYRQVELEQGASEEEDLADCLKCLDCSTCDTPICRTGKCASFYSCDALCASACHWNCGFCSANIGLGKKCGLDMNACYHACCQVSCSECLNKMDFCGVPACRGICCNLTSCSGCIYGNQTSDGQGGTVCSPSDCSPLDLGQMTGGGSCCACSHCDPVYCIYGCAHCTPQPTVTPIGGTPTPTINPCSDLNCNVYTSQHWANQCYFSCDNFCALCISLFNPCSSVGICAERCAECRGGGG
ncbi:MAG TPA: hypothetical protein PKD37_01315 [Oligoflexia bacterium]|nr:hypothetical protein [Oligoflexia bacterium]HMP26615.1 hypothetical protein [Oligoflexia bacterium]